MPKPKNKTELLHLSRENFQKLQDYIFSIPDEKRHQEFPEGTLNRNIRDVLAHLHHWHLLMLNWYEVGMSGEKPDMPANGYTWKTTSSLNKWIWEQYQTTDLEKIQELLMDSHRQVFQLIEKHSDEELFEKKRYHWTGSTSLGAYLISATSSHYDWGWKLIRKAYRGRL